MKSYIELKDLEITTNIGTYQAGEVVPSAHILDLCLTISPRYVFIDEDLMERVFDYDPLIAKISKTASNGHYETQERLITKIAFLCAQNEEVIAADIYLRKFPVSPETGTLGVRLQIDQDDLQALKT